MYLPTHTGRLRQKANPGHRPGAAIKLCQEFNLLNSGCALDLYQRRWFNAVRPFRFSPLIGNSVSHQAKIDTAQRIGLRTSKGS